MKPPDPTFLDGALRSAVVAVRRAARLLRRHRYAPPPLVPRSDGSAVSDLDLKIERLMRGLIRERHPGHAIVGEEEPFEAGDAGWVWYLDPIDGTRAFTAGQDACSAAATLTRDGVAQLAAVAAPFAGELYTAVIGRPSEVNGRTIRTASPRPLADAEILVYYDAQEPGLGALQRALANREAGRISIVPGSFILNACRAARGAYDVCLYVKRKASPLAPWDLAPAALVLQGAGGVLQDLEGQSIGGMIPAREVIAGAPGAAREIGRLLGTVIRDPKPLLPWARRNEAVFARLCGFVYGRAGASRCFIGIGGAGGGIGKSSLARELAGLLGERDSRVVALDDYLIERKERDARGLSAHDPASTDLDRAASDLGRLRAGEAIEKPVYDHERGEALRTETVAPTRIVLVEGVMALHPLLRGRLDVAIYIDATPSVRFRRVERDVEEKRLSQVYAQAVYERFEEEVRRHLAPLRAAADVVLAVDESFHLVWVSPDA
jgi:fructose-1,6-bisphosphatase/inositol monophosphatase family enzyme/uridine kinase